MLNKAQERENFVFLIFFSIFYGPGFMKYMPKQQGFMTKKKKKKKAWTETSLVA